MVSPRIPPATRREMGLVNTAITGALGAAAGTGPPNLFTTLARHRRMFRPWLLFAGTLMPGGTLPRRDTELVILRVAHLCECEYEWHHHAQLARQAGLTDKELAAVLEGPAAAGWTPRQRLLLTAAEELLNTRTLSDETWQALRGELSERHLIELPMLVGHYEMLAMTINSLRIQPDTPRRPTGLARVVQALSARFTGRSA
ncbi:carboxymuconolactone decarboxylase family protein [Thermocrispum municipale]|jgi:AhpD family alkylhydroperoxidase|uniref:carboxymuconolactone decarboxylase family protein n=1 Tax=Thermocrispum municipale TaxID=37926 RepID=UPI00048CF35C|nr:carboxymuconolactone decarboxylase family protein [Thermocrispum municipale]